MVMLGSIVDFRDTSGPDRVARYNLYPAAELQGEPAPGVSSTTALNTIKQIADETLPSGFSFEWTDLSYQQVTGGNAGLYVFPICVLFVYLVLAAQYGSWTLPFAVILIVPMCLFAATIGVRIMWWRLLEVVLLDVHLAGESDGSLAEGGIRRVVRRVELFYPVDGIVFDRHFERLEQRHSSRSALIEDIPDRCIQDAVVNRAVGLRNTDAAYEPAYRLGRHAASAQACKRRHPRIVPARHVAVAHQLSQPAF